MYNEGSINVLKGLDAIRTRPGMYIGDIGETGLHHCVHEVIDNSVDEPVAGYGKAIKLTLKNNTIIVEDEGRGIPVGLKDGVSAATIALTVLHAGGKFDKNTYKTSGGLHGIGIKATNATSKYLKINIKREGKEYQQEFEKGVPLYAMKEIGSSKKTGTRIEFTPDDTLFEVSTYNPNILKQKLKNASYLTKNIKFIYEDENEKLEFYSENGIVDMLRDDIESPIFEPLSISFNDEKYDEQDELLEKFDAEIALTYENGYETKIKSFANKILTPQGGVHEQGVLDALTSALLKRVQDSKVSSKKDAEILTQVNSSDVKEGLSLIVSLSIYTELVFEGQTKQKLSGQYIRSMLREGLKSKIEGFLDENPNVTKVLVEKIIIARRARESANRARKMERKKVSSEIAGMLGKLSDCRSNAPEECELFISEGMSAGGSSKQGRDSYYQAVLPLKGKPQNVLKCTLAKALANEEILSLITALGCGYGSKLELDKLRYHKIILQMDADIDGSHIKQLLLTIFNTLFKPLILNGHVYVAVPPLHRVKYGAEVKYLKNDAEKKSFIADRKKEIEKSIKATKKYKDHPEKDEYLKDQIKKGLEKYQFNRFKGLGEMNPEQLAETTMDPQTRTVIQLKPDDSFIADWDEELEDIMNRRVAEQADKPKKDYLPELNVDNIIALVSSNEGVKFREMFLLRNI